MPTLADIYSMIDSLKRRGSDFVANPGMSLQQMVNNANDRARAFNELGRESTEETRQTGALYGPKTQELARQVAEGYNPVGMTSKVPLYGMQHRPTTIEQGAAPLHDLLVSFDKNIYGPKAAQYYGTGETRLDNDVLKVFNQVKGNPNAEVTIYRAVPQNSSVKINPGDWVTVSKEYAMEHGEGQLGGKYKIISQKVPASHVTTNADSILEQGYYPQ